ncbi:MAG: rRNA maturation RNase YbeY [Isosphaera sp.]|nr:rRNA maturation RNase YbeY [Isosphaera sp.]
MLRVSVANPYDYPLEFQRLKDAARAVFEGEGVAACRVTVAFVDDAHIHRLNNQFLQHDEPTDVLTFPYTQPGAKVLEGEVVIGYGVAKEYAADRGHDPNLELLLYTVHGCLHLCGYADADEGSAAEMRAKEREYLAKLGLPDIAG